MPIFLALFLIFAVVTQVESMEGSQPAGATEVKGDVLYWEGEELVVRDITGREMRLHVNGQTKVEGVAGRLKTGDKIAAKVNSDGHALSITLQLPDGGSGGMAPGSR